VFLKTTWKISSTNFVMCSGSGSSKGGTTVEDQHKGQHVRKDDEDVEGHMHKNAPDMHKARKDDDDVEGHMHKNAPDMHKARNDDEDDDDVEGHMHKNAVNQGMHKA
jgi:hypothetical protein